MWVFEEQVNGRNLTEIINQDHENVKYLPGMKLPENVVREGPNSFWNLLLFAQMSLMDWLIDWLVAPIRTMMRVPFTVDIYSENVTVTNRRRDVGEYRYVYIKMKLRVCIFVGGCSGRCEGRRRCWHAVFRDSSSVYSTNMQEPSGKNQAERHCAFAGERTQQSRARKDWLDFWCHQRDFGHWSWGK